MNRVTGGRNNNRKNVRRNSRLGNTVRVKTGRKKFLPKLKGNARLAVKRASVLTMMIICLFFVFSKTDNLRAYFTDLKSITNAFSINAEYTITFNSNTGSGTMGSQSISYNVATALNTNSFTKTGYIFAGWNTESDGTGTNYTNGQEVTNIGDTTLYAQWEKAPIKYAVQIYGINQDEDSSGNKLGLTFGPATGANYNNSYVTHTYEETSAGSGEYYVKIVTHTVAADNSETTSEDYLYKNGGTTEKVTRTLAEKNKYDINMHEMTWTEIAQVSDKTSFLDCMLCGDTKSVALTLNSTIATTSVYNQYGDGAGILDNTINSYYRRWNPRSSDNSYVGTGVTLDSNEQNNGSNAINAGGYAVSHIRATLIGENVKTNKGYAGDVNLDTTNSLYTCIESDLQNVITAKKVKYVTGSSTSSYSLNDDIEDKIWLFSQREMYGTGQYTGGTTEGIGLAGDGYNKFGNSESKYYISSYNNSNTTNRVSYNEAGTASTWWLRSPYLYSTFSASNVYGSGNTSYGNSVYGHNGLYFGFCIQ